MRMRLRAEYTGALLFFGLLVVQIPVLLLFCALLGFSLHALIVGSEGFTWVEVGGSLLSRWILGFFRGTQWEVGLTYQQVTQWRPVAVLTFGILGSFLLFFERILASQLARGLVFAQFNTMAAEILSEERGRKSYCRFFFSAVRIRDLSQRILSSVRGRWLLLGAICRLVAIVVALFLLDWQLSVLLLAVFTPFGVVLLGVTLAFRRACSSNSAPDPDLLRLLIGERLAAVDTVRFFGLEESERQRLHQAVNEWSRRSSRRPLFRAAESAVRSFMVWLVVASAAVAAIRRLAEGRVGSLVFAESLVGLAALGLQVRQVTRRARGDSGGASLSLERSSNIEFVGTEGPTWPGVEPGVPLVVRGENSGVRIQQWVKHLALSGVGVGLQIPAGHVLADGTVLENTVFPGSLDDNGLRARAEAALVRVGIHGIHNQSWQSLNSRERWRVGLAQAVTLQPEYIFIEPPDGGILAQDDEILGDLLLSELSSARIVTAVEPSDWRGVKVKRFEL